MHACPLLGTKEMVRNLIGFGLFKRTEGYHVSGRIAYRSGFTSNRMTLAFGQLDHPHSISSIFFLLQVFSSACRLYTLYGWYRLLAHWPQNWKLTVDFTRLWLWEIHLLCLSFSVTICHASPTLPTTIMAPIPNSSGWCDSKMRKPLKIT